MCQEVEVAYPKLCAQGKNETKMKVIIHCPSIMLPYTWLFKFKCDPGLPLSTVCKYQTVIQLQAVEKIVPPECILSMSTTKLMVAP